MHERNTKQKKLILDAVCSTYTHPTAEQVHAMLIGRIEGLSLGTVYRNLSKMADSGLIRRISVNNSPDRFDGRMQPHQHLCCVSCGDFTDYFDDDSGDVGRIERETGFTASRRETVYYGICKNCNAEQK